MGCSEKRVAGRCQDVLQISEGSDRLPEFLPEDRGLKWSTKSGHRVKALNCHNEANADNSNDPETELHGSVQAGSGSAGNRAGSQDFGGGEELGYWREFVASLAPAI